MIKKIPLLLAFFVGYISLSQEILWVRVFGFVNYSIPQAFAAVLTIYLLGIALGAFVGKYFCSRFRSLYQASGVILVVSGIFDLVAPIFYGTIIESNFSRAILAGMIFLTAFYKSILFPIAHHLGAKDAKATIGQSISYVYFANVMGATLGPIVTGFILLDRFTVQNCMNVMGLATLLLGILCLFTETEPRSRKLAYACLSMVLATVISVKYMGPSYYSGLSTRIIEATSCKNVKQVVENKHGIIHICPSDLGDVVFGGNIYDGRMSRDPIVNSNSIDRLLILTALQKKPRRVLMVGLSGGAWLSILTQMAGVEKIDVVEINPGYLDVIGKYVPMSKGLMDPRVSLYIDDGRRWLMNRPDSKYDLIIMNTTFHWRANASYLLSIDFINLVKLHMTKEAIFTYNSTFSPDVFYTASVVFPFAYRYGSFIYVSDSDFLKNVFLKDNGEDIAKLVSSLKPSATAEKIAEVTRSLTSAKFSSIEEIESSMERSPEVITDRNMITEYKYGKLASYIRRYDSILSFLSCPQCLVQNKGVF